MFTMMPASVKSGGAGPLGAYATRAVADGATGLWLPADLSSGSIPNLISGGPAGSYAGSGSPSLTGPALFGDPSKPSLLMDGSSNRLLFGSISDFNPGNNFTYEMSVKPSEVGLGAQDVWSLMSHGAGGPSIRYRTGQYQVLMSFVANYGQGGTANADEVVLLTFVVQSDGGFIVYKNGTSVFVGSGSSGYLGNAQLQFGTEQNGGSIIGYYKGYVGSVAFYPAASTGSQVLARAVAAGLA